MKYIYKYYTQILNHIMSDAFENEEQQCVICYGKLRDLSIIEYKCHQCHNSGMCSDCFVKLSSGNCPDACPLCRYSGDASKEWYYIRDVEMGFIIDPDDIDPPDIDPADVDEEIQERVRREEEINKLCRLFKIIIWIAACIGAGIIWKSINNECYWNCKTHNIVPLFEAFILGCVIIPVVLMGLVAVWMLGVAVSSGCKYIKDNICQHIHIMDRENFKALIKKGLFMVVTGIMFILCAFAVGTLWKYNESPELCYWDCENESVGMTIFTSVLMGSFVIIAIGGCIFFAFICCASCIIGIMGLGTNENLR